MKHCLQKSETVFFIFSFLLLINVSFAQGEVIANWTFDEGSGDTIHDLSGNGHHGKIFDASWVSGISGSALSFDGMDDSAVVYHDGSLTGMDKLTIEAWVKLNAEITGQNRCIINAWGPESWEDDAWGMGFVNGDPHWVASVSGVNQGVHDLGNISYSALQVGLWYHLVMVYTGDSLRLYTNGKLSFADASMGEPIKAIPREVMIGWMDYDTNSNFDGVIDEITMYNNALSPDTILDHYTTLVKPRAKIAHWNFNEGEGDSAYDISGNNNHLRLYNGAKWVETHNGFGVALDGFDDVCKAADNPSQNGLRAFTAEAVFLIKQYNIYDQHTVIVDKWGHIGRSVGAWSCDLYNEGINALYGNVVGETNIVEELYSHDKLPLNKWIHLAFVWTGNSLAFYVNGEKNAATEETTIDIIQGSDSEIRVGNGADENNGLFGIIDDVVLYNYALSPDSIYSHYKDLIKPVCEVNLGIKKHYANPGDEIWVPVYIANFEDTVSISSIQFSLTFDKSIVTFMEASKDSGIASKWQFYNNPLDDSIAFSMGGGGQTIGYGEGELFRCKFKANTQLFSEKYTDLVIHDALIDEGNNIFPTTTNGKIIINDTSLIYGDVSGNNEVTAYDGAGIVQYIVGTLTLPDPNYTNFTTTIADVSGNGIITSFDAALVFKYSVGLLYKFPVETGEKFEKYCINHQFEEFPDAALQLVKSPLSTANTVYYDLFGSGIEKGVSCDITLKYDPEKFNVELGGDITTEHYYNLESSLDKVEKLVKLSITTVDKFTAARNIKLATIGAPAPDTSSLKDAMLFVKALINEQDIKDLDPMVPIEINGESGFLRKNCVMMNNAILLINNYEKLPVSVGMYDIRGRRVYHNQFSAANDQIRINTAKLAYGVYVFKVKIGANVIKQRFFKLQK